MLQELLRPTRASLKNWPRWGATLPNAKRSFFPSTNVSLPRNVGNKRFGANVHPMLLSVLKTKYKADNKKVIRNENNPETKTNKQAAQNIFQTPDRQAVPQDPSQTPGVNLGQRNQFNPATLRSRRRLDKSDGADRDARNFEAAASAGYMTRDQQYVDNAAKKDRDEFRKLMDDFAKEAAVIDKLQPGPEKERQIADMAVRKASAKKYYDDKAAQKNASTKTQESSEPSKVQASQKEVERAAAEVDEVIENAAAAKEKAGREMSSAAAK
jgi:hypothetical protein